MMTLTWLASDSFLAVCLGFLLIKIWLLPRLADYEKNTERILAGRVMGTDRKQVKSHIVKYIRENRAKVIVCIVVYILFSVGVALKLLWWPRFVNWIVGISHYSVLLSDVVAILVILALTLVLSIPMAVLMRRITEINSIGNQILSRIEDDQ